MQIAFLTVPDCSDIDAEESAHKEAHKETESRNAQAQSGHLKKSFSERFIHGYRDVIVEQGDNYNSLGQRAAQT